MLVNNDYTVNINPQIDSQVASKNGIPVINIAISILKANSENREQQKPLELCFKVTINTDQTAHIANTPAPNTEEVNKLERLAEKGDLVAIFKLGKEFEAKKEYKRAYELFSKGAELGCIECQYMVAIFCYRGYAGFKDHSKAFELMSKVADSGNSYGNLMLGVFYSEGVGVPKDTLKAIDFLIKPINKDLSNKPNLECRRFLGPLLLQHPYQCQKICNLGLDWQRYYLANDPGLNLYHYVMAAFITNNPKAYKNIGDMFLKGEGVDKDINQALKYYETAVDLGSSEAMVALAEMYEKGNDVIKKDIPLAIAWYFRADECHRAFNLTLKCSEEEIAKAEQYLKQWPIQPLFKKEDLYPWNDWEVDQEGPKWYDSSKKIYEPKFIIDKSTGRRYLNETPGWIRFKCFWLTLGTPLIHGFMASVNIIYRIFKTLIGAQFWLIRREPSYNFKARVIDVGVDMLRIVLTPLALIGLQFAAIYGMFNTRDGRKLYATIERLYYAGFTLAPCFQPDPTHHAFGGDIDQKDQM